MIPCKLTEVWPLWPFLLLVHSTTVFSAPLTPFVKCLKLPFFRDYSFQNTPERRLPLFGLKTILFISSIEFSTTQTFLYPFPGPYRDRPQIEKKLVENAKQGIFRQKHKPEEILVDHVAENVHVAKIQLRTWSLEFFSSSGSMALKILEFELELKKIFKTWSFFSLKN